MSNLSINYKGSLNSKEEIAAFVTEMKDIIKIMKWPSFELDDNWDEPPSLSILKSDDDGTVIEGFCAFKGIAFQPHPQGDYMQFFFDHRKQLNTAFTLAVAIRENLMDHQSWISAKIPFAGLEVHVAMIKLLRHLKKRYISDLEVGDEGAYWDTNDLEVLKTRYAEIGGTTGDILKEGLQYISPFTSGDELIKRIDDILNDFESEGE